MAFVFLEINGPVAKINFVNNSIYSSSSQAQVQKICGSHSFLIFAF